MSQNWPHCFTFETATWHHHSDKPMAQNAISYYTSSLSSSLVAPGIHVRCGKCGMPRSAAGPSRLQQVPRGAAGPSGYSRSLRVQQVPRGAASPSQCSRSLAMQQVPRRAAGLSRCSGSLAVQQVPIWMRWKKAHITRENFCRL